MAENEKVNSLLEEISTFLCSKQKEFQSGEKFNAFNMAQIGTEETRHSAIIASLLDPHSSFGKGLEPLKAFLRLVGLDTIAERCNKDTVVVETERSIIGRRMDIVIDSPEFCIVIENKTITSDHDGQLEDYWEWLNTEKKSVPHQLFYLTFKGDNAVFCAKDKYIPISYRTHICNWLEKCASMSQDYLPNSIFCSQYQDFIKNTLVKEDDMCNDLLQQISHHFEAAVTIASNIDKTKAWLLSEYLTPRLTSNGFKIENATSESIITGRGLDYNAEFDHDGCRILFQFDHYYFWGGRIKIILNNDFVKNFCKQDFSLPENCQNNAWRIESCSETEIVLVKHDGISWGNDFFIALSKCGETREASLRYKLKEYFDRLKEAKDVMAEIKKTVSCS